MRRMLFANILALLCAVAVFGGSAVFAAANVATVEPKESAFFDDNFIQAQEPGIADLWTDFQEESPEPAVSSEDSPEASSEPPASSLPAVDAGRKPESSAPPASAPASSAPASSEPVSSQPVSSQPASSQAPVSSEEVSSEPPPSSDETSSEEEPSSEETSSEEISSEETSSEEPEESVEDGGEDFDVDPTLLDMVAGAVQREIIGINTPPSPAYYEAYKAQAVASHTYMEYQRQRTGAYPTMSYAEPMPQTLELVAEVLEKMVYYNGSFINASYHAASGGHTQSAIYVWGNPVPYLEGVESAYDDYDSASQISVSDMEDRLARAGIDVSGEPSEWFDLAGASYTDGDFINTISICGNTVTGRTLREGILGTGNLKSPKITDIVCDGESFTFFTKGFGHGVGLSQKGALGYAANEGWDYEMILTHYYPGTVVQ